MPKLQNVLDMQVSGSEAFDVFISTGACFVFFALEAQ